MLNKKVYKVCFVVPNMVYVRKKIVKGKEYYYLVKGVKGEKHTMQKVIAYIGGKETLRELYENIGDKLD